MLNTSEKIANLSYWDLIDTIQEDSSLAVDQNIFDLIIISSIIINDNILMNQLTMANLRIFLNSSIPNSKEYFFNLAFDEPSTYFHQI